MAELIPQWPQLNPNPASLRIASVQSRGMSRAAPLRRSFMVSTGLAIFGFSHFDPLGISSAGCRTDPFSIKVLSLPSQRNCQLILLSEEELLVWRPERERLKWISFFSDLCVQKGVRYESISPSVWMWNIHALITHLQCRCITYSRD